MADVQKIVFRIYSKDLMKGKQGSCEACPVALAITRKLKWLWRDRYGMFVVVVQNNRVKVQTEKGIYLAYLTDKQRQYIMSFDIGGIVIPRQMTIHLTLQD